ncbi:helix-turn-helix domain-containing protein [Occultella aeris]|uniref:Anaerobic benzoate catabolism transcriptional regulator n=1 Tax=Occultella aeris TaxID=2761496 RepID=A0A7M4DRE2_9MICO|nr:XRE family transcriptional regulator [Occultella aeris]VZO40036.1 anaerobic benzoate catabolism transcriptional regulator [Occultella aeris]
MGAVADFEQGLGASIRERRRALGLTLVQVAEQTGLTHSFLSQLERGLTRASMRSLFAIAKALETTQEELIASASAEPARSTVTGGQARARLLMHVGDTLDVTEYSALPAEHGDFFDHERPEFVYVVSGRIEFELRASAADAVTTLQLEAGETFTCPGGMQHRYRSVGAPAKVLMLHYDV